VTRDEFDGIDIRRELSVARPEPTDEFVSMLADRVRAEQPRRGIAPRMALAFAMTVAGLAVAAAFGGISQAASSVEGAVSSIVHVGQKAKPSHAPAASGATASSVSTGTANGSHSQFGGGPSHGGSHNPPPLVQPPGSSSDDQYNLGCIRSSPRGPYINCRVP
jgi:hypothetical protein